jgi:hypothetical protein
VRFHFGEFVLFSAHTHGVLDELYSSDAQLSTTYRVLMDLESVTTSRGVDAPSVSGICARVNQRVETVKVQRREKAIRDESRDQDRGKGATEQDSQNEGGNTSMQGQLSHREEDEELKKADRDLPG